MKCGIPCYYTEFKCIADKCEHSCCIGWEIDIDPDTLALYENVKGALGDKIKSSIVKEGGTAFFGLGEDGRCPHLNSDGLCDIIIGMGEEGLCDICHLHPRFKNFFTGYEETGLGLSCEEAARIIINTEEPFQIIADSLFDEELTDEEKEIIEIREDILAALTCRELKLSERLIYIGKEFGFNVKKINPEKLISKFLSLERLDETWTKILENAKGKSFSLEYLDSDEMENAYEQLASYFVFRHFTKCLDDGDMVSKIKFSIVSVMLLAFLLEGVADKEKLSEYARIFSSEIEYSEDNTNKLYKIL